MKMAPIIEAMNAHPEKIHHLLVHTGQHYDARMSNRLGLDRGIDADPLQAGLLEVAPVV
jgi:UDP-N-acetylglucosamine 2-epimerase (non-hydrolysing)